MSPFGFIFDLTLFEWVGGAQKPAKRSGGAYSIYSHHTTIKQIQ